MRQFIQKNQKLAEKLKESCDEYQVKQKKKEIRLLPLHIAEKAADLLNDMDTRIIPKMAKADLARLDEQMQALQSRADEIRKEIAATK